MAPIVAQERSATDASALHKRPRTVNLLGATPLDLVRQRNIDIVEEMLASAGWEVLSCWCMDSSLERLAYAPEAACNVVMSASGVPLAKWMERTWGIPYIWGSFVGARAFDDFVRRLEATALGETDGKPAVFGEVGANVEAGDPSGTARSRRLGGTRALVVGDQVVAEGCRHALRVDYGFESVQVVSFFDIDDAHADAEDRGNVTERELLDLLCNRRFDVVVGDGLLAQSLPDDSDATFIEMPYPALSSRISWDKPIDLFGFHAFEQTEVEGSGDKGDCRTESGKAGSEAGESETETVTAVHPGGVA